MERQHWELEEMERPRLWSDREWRALGAVIEEHRDWIKCAYHPDHFRLAGQHALLAQQVVERGGHPSARPDEGLSVELGQCSYRVWPAAGRCLRLARHLAERTGRWADDRAWLACADAGAVIKSDRLWVIADTDPDVDDLGAVVSKLEAAAEKMVAVLSNAGWQFGFEDLVDQFIRARLVVPSLPDPLRIRLALKDEWLWSTLAEDQPDRMQDYLLESVSWLERPIADHATISHGGHGMNSYGLTWRMAYGPIALVAQGLWGGAVGAAADNAQVATLFADVGRVTVAFKERFSFSAEPRRRPIVVDFSNFRSPLHCRRWRATRNRWEEIELPRDKPWTRVAALVEETAEFGD